MAASPCSAGALGLVFNETAEESRVPSTGVQGPGVSRKVYYTSTSNRTCIGTGQQAAGSRQQSPESEATPAGAMAAASRLPVLRTRDVAVRSLLVVGWMRWLLCADGLDEMRIVLVTSHETPQQGMMLDHVAHWKVRAGGWPATHACKLCAMPSAVTHATRPLLRRCFASWSFCRSSSLASLMVNA